MAQTITEILEDVKEKMCNDYCKYPNQPTPEGKDEDWLFEDEESPCVKCPLNQL